MNDIFYEVFYKLKKVFSLTKEEETSLLKSPTFKMVLLLPFVAHSKDKNRYALANGSAYITAMRLGNDIIVNANETDNKDFSKRISYFTKLKGGLFFKKARVKLLLQLAMLLDYNTDKEEDKKLNKYNPIVSGDINFEKKLKDILFKLHFFGKDELDNAFDGNIINALMPEPITPKGFWRY